MSAAISRREGSLLLALVIFTLLAGLYLDAAAAPGAEPRVGVTHFRVGQRNVKSIYAEAGVVWVGTSDGLIRYDVAGDSHQLFDRRHGLSSSNVLFVGRADGRVLAATAGGPLFAFDERSGKWTRHADALAVLDVLETGDGELWIATLSGVLQVPAGQAGDAAKWRRHTVHSTGGGLPGVPVYGVARGRRGEIWLATEAGVARFRDGRWQRWQFDGAPRVVTIKVDARGTVWAGTWGGGLRRFDGRSWRAYTLAHGLPGNHVLSLYAEPRGALWIGTDKGIARMRGGRLEARLGTREAIPGGRVSALARSDDDSLWVGSFGGVARLRPAGAL